MVAANRLGVLVLVGTAAALGLLALSHHASAGEYWVAGLPAGGAINAGQGASTAIAVVDPNAAGDTATLNKVTSGTATPIAATPVASKSTGLVQFTDFQYGSQLNNVGIYYVGTTLQDDVYQLTSAGNSVAGLAGGSGVDATHILETGRLGTAYTVISNANPSGPAVGIYIPPNRNYVTVVATKDGTVVTVKPTAATAPSSNPAGPGFVGAMAAGGTYTFPMQRGQGLHFEAGSLGSPDCAKIFVQWFILGANGAPCYGGDLTGTKITATSPVAVFAGSDCWGKDEGNACDVINQEMFPDILADKTYVICVGSTLVPRTSDMELLRIAAPGPAATLTFAVAVRPTAFAAASITGATVPAGGYSQFFLNQNTVITSTAPILVEHYIDRWLTVPANQGNPISKVTSIVYGWSGPSQVSVTSMERARNSHWLYAYAGFDNHITVGGPLGMGITDDIGSGPVGFPAMTAIGTSGYGCTSILDGSPTPNTHSVTTSGPAVVEMIGAGQATAYWYDSGGSPIPPPPPPVAGFKFTAKTDGCGDAPVQFSDSSTPGAVPIIAWAWDFGDGSTSSAPSPSHTYASPGTYDVTLTVTDASGATSSNTQTVTAYALPPCLVPTKSQDNAYGPRPPRDGIDDSLASSDVDGDGVVNAQDNCPTVANADQSDLDGDFIGDLCDADMDGDGVINASDNCPKAVNTGQVDLDGDGLGNACDDDLDGDTIGNAADNCVMTPNKDQDDADKNLIGDACEEAAAPALPVAEASRPLALSANNVAPSAASGNAMGALLPALVGLAVLVVLVLVVALRRRN